MIPSEEITIETPEQIPLDFPLAGVGSRSLAIVIDSLFIFVVWLGLFYLVSLVELAIGTDDVEAGHWIKAGWILVQFVLVEGYFVLFEALRNGQTPGKHLVGLRVIADAGRPITVYESLVRNLLRLIDWLPVLYAYGILSVFVTRRNQRLGDIVAGTVVVRERSLLLAAPVWGTDERSDMGNLEPRHAGIRMSAAEIDLIEAFLSRRDHLEPGIRDHSAIQIATRIARIHGLPDEDARRPEELLETLARAHRRGAGYRR